MCNIRWYVIITGISVKGLLIEPIIGEIVVNNNTEAGSIFFWQTCGPAETMVKRLWNPI